MQEWIYEYLEEMMRKIGVELTYNVSDILTEYSKDIAAGVIEGYYLTSNYVADCNLKDSIKSNEKSEIESLKNELSALYSAIGKKGYNFYYRNNRVFETGMQNVGGTVSASYDREV